MSLTLRQDLEALGIAGVVWDCGVAVASLLDQRPALVRGRQVLDLGCGGSAIAGLAAAACGARTVTLTDLPPVSELAKANIAANVQLGPCRFVAHRWEDTTWSERTPNGASAHTAAIAPASSATQVSAPAGAAPREGAGSGAEGGNSGSKKEVLGASDVGRHPLGPVLPFDTILCSDCLYDQRFLEPLAGVLR